MKNKKKRVKEMLRPQHFSQQILNGKLFMAIIGGQKSNFSSEFKLELLKT